MSIIYKKVGGIMRIYDLTHFIEEDMSAYCDEEKAKVNDLSTIDKEGYNVKEIKISSHTGTHIDVPNHIFKEGYTLENMPKEMLVGNAYVIDCKNKKEIEVEYLKENIKEIEKYNYIILKTGDEALWKKESYLKNIITLTNEASSYLGSLESLYGVGIDSISIDRYDNEELNNHKNLLGNDKIIIENLKGLEECSGSYEIIVAPLKIKGSDGAPARVILLER